MSNEKATGLTDDQPHPGEPVLFDLTADGFSHAVNGAIAALGKDEAMGRVAGPTDEKRAQRLKGTGRYRGKPDLAHLAADLEQFLREGYGVAAKKGSRNAHDLLLRLAQQLPDFSHIRATRGGDLSSPEAHRQMAVDACERFCQLINPDSYIAYFWDRHINRTMTLLRTVEFPECMDGISFNHDLPRQELFNESESPADALDVHSLHVRGSPAHGVVDAKSRVGTFRMRERVETLWVARVRWNQGRLVLFLNWRKGSRPTLCPPTEGKPAIEVNRPLEVRDIRPAVRYLAGYLGSINVGVAEGLARPSWQPCSVLHDILRVLEHPFPAVSMRRDHPTENSMTAPLTALIRTLVATNHPHLRCNFHWTDWTQRGSPATQLYFRRISGPPDHKDVTRDFSLTTPFPPDRAIVKESITYQAAVWGAPILIQDMETGPNAAIWNKLDIAPPDSEKWTTRSQMAVPLKDSAGSLIGVVNIETDSAALLSRETLRSVQLALGVFGRLLELKPECDGSQQAWTFIRRALNPNSGAVDVETFLTSFCDFVLRESGLQVHQVYVLTYDAEARVFRPRAVRSDEKHYEYIFEKSVGRRRTSNEHRPPPALMEDAVARRLIPKRRGRTWDVFAKGEPVVAWPTVFEEPRPSQYARDCFRALVGLPFCSDVGAQPDGVIWLRWKDDPITLLNKTTQRQVQALDATVRPSEDIRQSVKQQIRDRAVASLGPTLGAVAAVYSLIRVGETSM